MAWFTWPLRALPTILAGAVAAMATVPVESATSNLAGYWSAAGLPPMEQIFTPRTDDLVLGAASAVLFMVAVSTAWRWFGKRDCNLKRDVAEPNAKVAQATQPRQSKPREYRYPATHPSVPGDTPRERLRSLQSQLDAYASGARNTYSGIEDLHFSLGQLGIPWPCPGIDPPFRRAISEELLEACRDGDMERARAAWATVKARMNG